MTETETEIKIVEREITLLSQPGVPKGAFQYMMDAHQEAGASKNALDEIARASDAALICQFAGRGCYRSFEVPNAATDTPLKYLRNLAKQFHFSVFEHANFSFRFDNISRAASHEIVRHRHLSPSQESQRYVTDKRGWEIILPPALEGKLADDVGRNFYYGAEEAFIQRDRVLGHLKDSGLKKKQAAEAARSLTPNAAATSMVLTGNSRAWMEFISKRHSPAADAELQQIAGEIWDELRIAFPEAFNDPEIIEAWYGKSEQKENKF